MSGLVFTGCDGRAARGRAAPASAPRPVRRERGPARTIDVHAHCAFPQAMALMGIAWPAHPHPGLPPALKVSEDQIPARLAAMDAQGIDLEVLSINPFWYRADPDLARQIV